MRFMENTVIAISYAGITQVRFKGYLLSPNRHPLFRFLLLTPPEIKTESVIKKPTRAIAPRTTKRLRF